MTKGKVASINVSQGGVPKLPIARAAIRRTGVEGDAQSNLKLHGGPERAVCLYSLERIEALRAEGHPIEPGSAGDNITVSGLEWDTITPGTTLKIGQAVVQVTSYTIPCKTIRHSFAGHQFTRISQKTNPGWSRVYARVVGEGETTVGDAVEVIGSL